MSERMTAAENHRRVQIRLAHRLEALNVAAEQLNLQLLECQAAGLSTAIDQIDMRESEDGESVVAFAHLSDGNAIATSFALPVCDYTLCSQHLMTRMRH